MAESRTPSPEHDVAGGPPELLPLFPTSSDNQGPPELLQLLPTSSDAQGPSSPRRHEPLPATSDNNPPLELSLYTQPEPPPSQLQEHPPPQPPLQSQELPAHQPQQQPPLELSLYTQPQPIPSQLQEHPPPQLQEVRPAQPRPQVPQEGQPPQPQLQVPQEGQPPQPQLQAPRPQLQAPQPAQQLPQRQAPQNLPPAPPPVNPQNPPPRPPPPQQQQQLQLLFRIQLLAEHVNRDNLVLNLTQFTQLYPGADRSVVVQDLNGPSLWSLIGDECNGNYYIQAFDRLRNHLNLAHRDTVLFYCNARGHIFVEGVRRPRDPGC